MDLDIRQFERPSSKPVLLQFYAAVAASSRALSPHGSEYRMFESQARQLAGELFDDLHEETAVGFHLLAFFAHGEDFARGSHYREMSKSMCQRLLERRDLSEESRMRLVRLEIMNASLRGIQDVATARDYDQVSHQASMLPPMAGGDCLPLEELLAMFSFRTRFASLFNVEEAPFESLAIRPLLLEEIREFSRMIDHHVQWFVQDKLVAPNQVDLAYATFCIFKTVILYAGHRAQDALVLLKQAILVFEANSHLISFLSPPMADLFHLAFLVAYSSRDYFLVSAINRVQMTLSEILPSTRVMAQQDAEKLHSLSPTLENQFYFVPATFSTPCINTSLACVTPDSGRPDYELPMLPVMSQRLPVSSTPFHRPVPRWAPPPPPSHGTPHSDIPGFVEFLSEALPNPGESESDLFVSFFTSEVSRTGPQAPDWRGPPATSWSKMY